MIKSLRSVTKLLGKLGVKSLVTDHDAEMTTLSKRYGFPQSRPPWPTGKTYGWGLKESKDFTELYLDRKAAPTST